MKTANLHFWVNDERQDITVPLDATLLDVLREQVGLTGAKRGCEIGECGACTVLLNGEAVNACLVLALTVQGQKIETVEGLADAQGMNDLQQSFVDDHAVQCGFCTPGMLMSATALLRQNKNPDEQEIRQAISGNLCRCTGYNPIVKAIKTAAKKND